MINVAFTTRAHFALGDVPGAVGHFLYTSVKERPTYDDIINNPRLQVSPLGTTRPSGQNMWVCGPVPRRFLQLMQARGQQPMMAQTLGSRPPLPWETRMRLQAPGLLASTWSSQPWLLQLFGE